MKRVRMKRAPAAPDRAEVSRGVRDLVSLIYELLDAHRDTVELLSPCVEGLVFRAHLDYLQALHRKGHEALAQLGQRGGP